MALNSILTFAQTDTGTNIETQAAYLAASDRLAGNQPGVARSKLVNKALKQTSLMAAGLGQFIARGQGIDVVDTLTPDNISNMLGAAIPGRYLRPVTLGVSGIYVPGIGCTTILIEMCGGGGGGGGASTTAGSAISAGTGGASGSYLRHLMVNPGTTAFTIGSGGQGGTSSGGGGGTGGATTFGSLVASGGGGGLSVNATPPWLIVGGMPAAVSSGGNLFNSAGAQGGQGFALGSQAFISGGGGASPFGGGAPSLGTQTSAGYAAQSYGAGGGGGLCGTTTPGQLGGNGGNGFILIHEFGGT